MWPSTVREIMLSSNFSHPISKAVWPKNLQVLKLGEEFNRPLEGVDFPDGMHRIEFWGAFDQPIAGVKWPSRLRVLKFGESFNRRVVIPLDVYGRRLCKAGIRRTGNCGCFFYFSPQVVEQDLFGWRLYPFIPRIVLPLSRAAMTQTSH